MKRLSAAHLRARRVWSCKGCGVIHNVKPAQCLCGRLDFISWDSMGEQKRFAELRLLEMAGEISELQRQVRFPLYARRPSLLNPVGDANLVGHYVADFVYTDKAGVTIVEDFKGGITDLAAWKLRHMDAQGTPVRISTSAGIVQRQPKRRRRASP